MRQVDKARSLAAAWLYSALQGCAEAEAPAVPRPLSVDAGDAGAPDATHNDAAYEDVDAGSPRDADSGTEPSPVDTDEEADPALPLTRWESLADATWSQWYRYLPSTGRDADARGVFKAKDGVLHVLGIEPTSGDQEFGYIATREEFSNYRFRVEQRWGTRKFAPRAGEVRDSGLLHHMRGDDRVWPQSVEFQIQENDIGDLFLLSDVGATTVVAPETGSFKEGGDPRSLRNGAVRKGSTHESLTEWNSLELIASGREFVHIANGFVNHRGWALEFLQDQAWRPLDRGRILLQAEGAEVYYRQVQLRPIQFAPAPKGAIVLFDGSNLDAWEAPTGSGWHVQNGELEVGPGSGDLITRARFGDVRLHLEFRVPATSDPNAAEQDRGNSGVFLQGRYEVQILDSFGRSLAGANDAAAIYGVRDAAINEALPPETWQSYDLVFRAARFAGDDKRSPARVSLVWNGSEAHRAVELSASTAGGDPEGPSPGPLRLQNHDAPVRFRNIWLQPL